MEITNAECLDQIRDYTSNFTKIGPNDEGNLLMTLRLNLPETVEWFTRVVLTPQKM